MDIITIITERHGTSRLTSAVESTDEKKPANGGRQQIKLLILSAC
jgi:hypothetical protein